MICSFIVALFLFVNGSACLFTLGTTNSESPPQPSLLSAKTLVTPSPCSALVGAGALGACLLA
ncbi:hypothetical protein V8F20_002244 [Naviculisporaceae sp. PSN 640]